MSVPAWGSIAEWNFSLPARDCRHWKNMMPSAPRAIDWAVSAASAPGGLPGLAGRQLTASVACSIRSHGTPGFSERMRSRWNAASRTRFGFVGSG